MFPSSRTEISKRFVRLALLALLYVRHCLDPEEEIKKVIEQFEEETRSKFTVVKKRQEFKYFKN